MVCINCGQELSEDSRFCSRCGTRVQGTMPDASPVFEAPASSEAYSDKLVIRREKITADRTGLTIDGTYYTKKTGHRKFKRKKELLTIPFSSVTAYTRLHDRYGGRILVFLLLFVIFTGGFLSGGFLCQKNWTDLNTPYRASKTAGLEKSLKRLESSVDEEQAALDSEYSSLTREAEELETLLAEYENNCRKEVLKTVIESADFNCRDLLECDFFQDAWEQYISDLLTAFKSDERIDSWLYLYYTCSLEKGDNLYIEEDLWVYDNYGNEDEKYSASLKDYESFWWTRYDYSFYDHLSLDGRIYITAADFLNFVLYLENYAVNGAVLVKAFGGTPDPEEMRVPGWTTADYDDFWANADTYYYSSYPVWMDYNLSAEDFALNWNQLVDEKAYYDAYKKFMDTVAPGLPCYDMAQYYGSDEAFGGMGYSMGGKEASMNRIITLYLESHPSYLEDLGIDLDSIASSYDGRIEETKLALDENAAKLAELRDKQAELDTFLASADELQKDYDTLRVEIAERTALLRRNLLLFSCITVFLLLMAVICLCKLIGYLRRPRRLFVLTMDDTDIAFHTRHCSQEALEDLEKRLPC